MKLFGRKKKEKGPNEGGGEVSENDFLSSLPAKASKRYSMAYSSFSPPGTTSSSYKNMQPDNASPQLNGNGTVKLVDDKGKAIDTPEFFVNTIKMLPNLEILASLCSMLQTKPATWAKTLIEHNGIDVLLDVLVKIEQNKQDRLVSGKTDNNDIILQSLTLTCLLSLMNSKFGIEKALVTPGAMKKLILTMDTPKLDTRSSVLEILTAVCIISDNGYSLVLDAFSHFKTVRKERLRFTFLVETMRTMHTDRDYITICLGLINGLVNSPDEVDERVQLRTEFSRLGLEAELIKHKKIPYEEAPDLLTQIDVYEEESRSDQEELLDKFSGLDINIENPQDVFSAILAQTKDVLYHPLLQILQSMLSVPSDTDTGMLTWFLIERLVQQVSISKLMVGEGDERVSLEELLTTVGPSVAMQGQLQQVTDELVKAKDQLKKAQFDLNVANTELTSRSHEQSVMKSNMFNTVKMKNQELSKLRGTIRKIDSNFFTPPSDEGGNINNDNNHHVEQPQQTLQHSSSSPSPISPPLTGTVKETKKSETKSALKKESSHISDLKPPKSALKKESSSKQLVDDNNHKETQPVILESQQQPPPPPPMMGGPPPPPPPMGGPPPPPPMGGGPPPPPPMGNGSSSSSSSAPKFKIAKPTTKVKQLQWTKIPHRKVGETIFNKLGNVKTDWLDADQIENLFFAAESNSLAASRKGSDDKKSNVAAKPGSVTVIDPKKAQNIAIYLSKFKCTIPDIRNAIYTLDEEILNVESLKLLDQYLPTEEDMESIKDYLKQGELKMLSKPEHFLLEIDSVTHLPERVKSFLLKSTFPDKLREIKPDLELFVNACKQITRSKNFLKVIEVILVIGNFLNGGSARGDCFGFKLDGLLKLTDTKTFNNKSNLLVYIISELESKFPEALEFIDELDDVQAAGKISLSMIQGDLNKLKKDLEAVVTGVGKMKRSRDESFFFESIDEFIKDANIEIKIANEQYATADKEFQTLAKMFGEEPKVPSEEFFSLMAKFITTFDKCYKDYQHEKEAAERAAKREAAKAKKVAMVKKVSGGASGLSGRGSASKATAPAEGMVDDILQTVRDGDAFKQRRQRKVPLASGTDSQRGDKSGDGAKDKSSSGKENGSAVGSGTLAKKDLNVAAKALTVVMRARTNYSRIDQFSFSQDDQ